MTINSKRIKKIIEKPMQCDRLAKECVEVVISAKLPSAYGKFKIVAFHNNVDHKEHIAIVKGDVANKDNVVVRLHSECLTGDVFGSLRCDCREQLVASLDYLEKQEYGVLLYLRQEGRGIGLTNKIKAYFLQENGYDTVEANHALGFPDDLRNYNIASAMLKLLKVRSIMLLTNNPKKIKELGNNGIRITDRIPIEIKPNQHNKGYLETKKYKSGHLINL